MAIGNKLFAAIALFALAGCATAPTPRGLSVSVVNILPTSASLLETTADLTIRVVNESGTPIVIGGGAHRLFLNNMYVGRGVTNAGLAVPALSTSTQTFQVHIENLAVFAQLWNKASPDQVVSYRLESEFYDVPGQRTPSMRASSSGSIDLGTFAAFKR